MRRWIQVGAVAVSGLSLLGLVSGCGGGETSTPTPPPATITITTTTLPNGSEGAAYSQSVATSGGQGSRTWSVSAGTLPAGLSQNASTGVISGTPTAPGTSNFTVQVTDSTGSDTQDLSITIAAAAPVNITTTTLPNATKLTSYGNRAVTTTGGLGPFTWDISAGALPAGLTQNTSTGVISGTPTCAATTQTFTVRVRDSSAAMTTDTHALTVTVNPVPLLNITTTALPNGVVSSAYNQTVQATGGITPRTFAVTSGALPTGLNLNASTGAITGTPTQTETANFSIAVTDACGATDTQALSITISATALGRNDSRATATALTTGGNQTINASISPFTDTTVTTPDEDFYELTVANGAVVVFDVTASNPPVSSPLDPVIEIQDINGLRLTTCRIQAPDTFTHECMNDDRTPGNLDSRLEFQNNTGGTITIFLRVLDWRGDARPDLIYQITISGAQ